MSDLQTEQRNRTTMVPRGTGWAVIDEITLCEFGYYERHADAWAMVREYDRRAEEEARRAMAQPELPPNVIELAAEREWRQIGADETRLDGAVKAFLRRNGLG